MSGFSVEWHGDEVVKAINEAAADALEECIDDLYEKSQEICPTDQGDLKESAQMFVDRELLIGRVGYGTNHAIVQHERQDFKHKPGQQAKFIEAPLNANGRIYLTKIADNIRSKVFNK